jgi:3-oxoadipate enol-lactonase
MSGSSEAAGETRKIDLRGHSLRVRILGDGPRTIVCLHDYSEGIDAWNEAAPLLAKLGRVVLIEIRAHGYSSAPEGDYRWEDLAGDVVGVLDALAVDRAVLVGHRFGGIVAIATALQAPARVERLVLIGTATDLDAARHNQWREVIKSGRMNGLEGIAHALHGPISRQTVEGNPVALTAIARLAETLQTAPLTPRLGEVRCPVLVLAGEKDPLPTAPLAAALPDARVETLANLGPSPQAEDAGATVAAIARFLA